MSQQVKTLQQAVVDNPFLEFREWWLMGNAFLRFMSHAIVSEWSQLHGNEQDLASIHAYTLQYLKTVYEKEVRDNLVEDFVDKEFTRQIYSGEFDALSYAFHRTAFELIESHAHANGKVLDEERRAFTKRVGKKFYRQVHDHLQLELPDGLDDERQFQQLRASIQQVGAFLSEEGYLPTHFAFYFHVELEHAGRQVRQSDDSFVRDLHQNGVAYALYEMGHPVILPSAVYLYRTIGEAQHHSSRTIEELFEMVGYDARETDDFDPSEHSSENVIELWEIRKLA